LQASITIYAPAETLAHLASLGDELRFGFITSGVTLVAADELRVEVQSSQGTKCARCWHYTDDVGQDPQHAALCGRCVSNLHGQGEVRKYV